MAPEFVKIFADEKKHAQMHLLQSQVELLESIQYFRTFRELRQKEFLLKIEIKQKIEEAKQSMKALEKSLPESDFLLPEEEQPLSIPQKELSKKEATLEDEIEKIRKKLLLLQGFSETDSLSNI